MMYKIYVFRNELSKCLDTRTFKRLCTKLDMSLFYCFRYCQNKFYIIENYIKII